MHLNFIVLHLNYILLHLNYIVLHFNFNGLHLNFIVLHLNFMVLNLVMFCMSCHEVMIISICTKSNLELKRLEFKNKYENNK